MRRHKVHWLVAAAIVAAAAVSLDVKAGGCPSGCDKNDTKHDECEDPVNCSTYDEGSAEGQCDHSDSDAVDPNLDNFFCTETGSISECCECITDTNDGKIKCTQVKDCTWDPDYNNGQGICAGTGNWRDGSKKYPKTQTACTGC